MTVKEIIELVKELGAMNSETIPATTGAAHLMPAARCY